MSQPITMAPRERRRSLAPSVNNDPGPLIMRSCPAGMMTAPAAHALAALGRERRFAAGDYVFTRGDAAGSIWLMGSGSVALGTRGDSGLLQHRCSIEGGAWLDLASAFTRSHHAEDAVAESASLVWQFPLQPVLRAGHEHPELLAALAGALGETVVGLIESTRSLMMKDVQSRCATWLLEHAEYQTEGGQAGMRLHQRKRAIALQLGTTAETFSRTLRHLNRLGLIEVQGYTIRLLDLPGLRMLADPLAARAAPEPAQVQAMAAE